jgi:hypothetical protein
LRGLALGWLLPFLALAAVIALPVWRIGRRYLERRQGSTPTNDPAEST